MGGIVPNTTSRQDELEILLTGRSGLGCISGNLFLPQVAFNT